MPGLFALFKGDSGAGKTVGAISFPNPVVLDFDRKMPAIANKHFPGKPIPFKQYEDALVAGETVTAWLTQGCPFDTIIVDSITSLSYLCLKTMDDLKGTNPLEMFRTMKGTKKGGKMPEFRGYDYYNAEDSFLKFFIDNLKILWARPGRPHHVIVVAHVLTSDQPKIDGDVVTTRRIVTAGQKIAAYIPAQFDETYHFSVGHGDILGGDGPRVKHFCSTEAIGYDFAKTAYHVPPKIDFTNGSLFEAFVTALGEEPQPSSPEPSAEESPKPTKKLLL